MTPAALLCSLQGLKALTPSLTAVVSMSDDGGSTGVLHEELSLHPNETLGKLYAASGLEYTRRIAIRSICGPFAARFYSASSGE